MIFALKKTVVLVGLMGVGKTTVGKRLAKQLDVPFTDLDQAIEMQQDCSISEIFTHLGEKGFRDIEHRALQEELEKPPHILATGGGAYVQDRNRELIHEKGVVVWLKAELDVLVERVSRKNTRPLLEAGDKREIMEQLMKERYPVYEGADIIVESDTSPHGRVVSDIIEALEQHEHNS